MQFETPPEGYEEQFAIGSGWRYTNASRTSSAYVQVVGVLYDDSAEGGRDADFIVTVNRGPASSTDASRPGRLYARRRYEFRRTWEPRPLPTWVENTVYTVRRPATGPHLVCKLVFSDGRAVLLDPVAETVQTRTAEARADFKVVRAYVPEEG